MCVCVFSRQIWLCFAQNNWNFIGIFSLSSVNLSNFANFLEKFTKVLISENWEKPLGKTPQKEKLQSLGKSSVCEATSTLFDGYQKQE
jgi:hypothetical protein